MSKYFRFDPTDAELIEHLKLKTQGIESELDHFIAEINVHKWEPWELPAKSKLKSDIKEWWFLCPLDYKCLKSSKQVKRSTKTGYWKRTGEERKTKGCVGMKRNLVFYRGRQRTDWVIHEYYHPQPHVKRQDQKPTCVICRLMYDPQRKGRNSDAPDFEDGEPSGNITTAIESSVASAESPEEHGHDEVNHQPILPMLSVDASITEQALGFMLDNDMQVPYGENFEISGKTTSFPENPLAFADNNPSVKWDDGISLSDLENPISPVVSPSVQAPSGAADESNEHYPALLDSNFMEQPWIFPLDEEMQAPSGAADESNEYYEELPDLCVVNPKEKDYGETTDYLHNTSSNELVWSSLDGQFTSDTHTEEVNEQVEGHVHWLLDG
ncbi:NAC domain-containing protein 69-like [Humulus lupulus]|uniref:NAC domain-containing protein 69-like n=1 Tax=Humulus lupulus TaxID=3486 RepID=UPI002B4080A4|nr:NAC domain-containing protein 69-like [Humulus lupulus]